MFISTEIYLLKCYKQDKFQYFKHSLSTLIIYQIYCSIGSCEIQYAYEKNNDCHQESFIDTDW